MNEPNTQSTPNTPSDDLPLAITRAIESVERGEPVPGAPATGHSRPADATPLPSAAEGTTPTQPATEQPRDGSGRFAPKAAPSGPTDKPAEPTPAPATGTPAAPATTDAAPAAKAAEATANAPASWKEDMKGQWAMVPHDVRAEIHRREREIDRALAGSAERAKAASSILDEFVPYAEILQQENATPQAAIRTLLQTAYALRSAGPEYRKAIFLDLAQQYGVDLASGINPDQAQAEARAAQFEIDARMRRAADEARAQEQANYAISQFAATHEHFPVVREIMGNLLATGVCNDLETAYQQAMVLSPQMRPMLIQQEAQRLAQQQATQQQDEARRRAAASSVSGGPGGFSPGPAGAPTIDPKDDLRGSIAAALDRVGLR